MFIKNKLISDAVIYTCSNFAVSGVPFILLPFLTRVLSPEDYGIVSMYSMMIAFTTICVGLNAHGSLTVRFFDNTNFDVAEYASNILLIPFVSSIFIIVLFIIFSDFIVFYTGIPSSWLYACVLVSTGQFITQIQLVLWQAMRKPKEYGFLRVTQALLDALISISLISLLAMSWTGRLTGIMLSWIIVAIIAIVLLRNARWIVPVFKGDIIIDALKFGLPLIPHAIGGLILGMADRILVTNMLGLNSTGLYTVAIQLGLILGILAHAFNQAYAPWLMSKMPDATFEDRKKIVLFTYAYFLIIMLCAGALAFILPKVLSFMVGSQYQEIEGLLFLIFYGNAFTGMYYMVTNYLFYVRRTGILSILTISVGIISLALTWYFIKSHGLMGAAIGFMVGQALLFLGTWVLSNVFFPMPWLLRKVEI